MTPPSDQRPRNLLARLVHDRRWTMRDFQRQFATTAETLGVDMTTVSERHATRWLTGKIATRPYPAACRVLETMFNYSIEDLLASDTAHYTPLTTDGNKPLTVVPPPPSPFTLTAGPSASSGQATNDTPDPAWTREISMSLRRTRDFLLVVDQPDVGPAMLDEIHDEIRRLAHAMCTEPISSFVPDLLALQDLTFRLLENRQHPSRDLYFLTGTVSALVACVSLDLGNPQAAITHTRAAYFCADHAGHEPLKMFIRGVQGMTAFWAGWTADAAHYCQLGSTLGPVSGTVAVWLPSLQARVQAAQGDTDAAAEAIRLAIDAREQVTADDLDGIGGELTFHRTSQLYYAADAHIWLPDRPADAEHAALEAVTAHESATGVERPYGNEALSRAALSLARIRSGDIDGAQDALRPVLDLPPDLHIDPIRQAVRRLHRALSTPALSNSTTARAMIAETEYFARLPQPSMLPG